VLHVTVYLSAILVQKDLAWLRANLKPILGQFQGQLSAATAPNILILDEIPFYHGSNRLWPLLENNGTRVSHAKHASEGEIDVGQVGEHVIPVKGR